MKISVIAFVYSTCKWLFMCEIFSPFTPIICSILFGVASATSQFSEKSNQDSNTDVHTLSLIGPVTVSVSKPENVNQPKNLTKTYDFSHRGSPQSEQSTDEAPASIAAAEVPIYCTV